MDSTFVHITPSPSIPILPHPAPPFRAQIHVYQIYNLSNYKQAENDFHF